MAIINSMGVGRSRKSMGNVTYRTVRGRTIGSQKIVSGGATTRVPSASQETRRTTFGLISRFAAQHAESIDQSFNLTKYGTARNYFMKVNYVALKAALASLTLEATDEEIGQAIATYAEKNPTAIYRIKKAGFPVTYLSGAWDDSANPIMGKVYLNEVQLKSGQTAPALKTEDALKIIGDNLAGEVTLITTTQLGGSTTSQPQSTALTNVEVNPQLITADVASAINGQFLVQVKVGNTVIVSFSNKSDDGQDESPL